MNAEPTLHAPLGAATDATGATGRQMLRFGVVGVGVNLVLYLAYLALVERHVDVKLAMSLVYAGGVVLGFVLNRRWSFRRRGRLGGDVPAYVAVYFAGYLVNLAALALFVDGLGWAHQAVQAAMVFVVAAGTFLLQKHWVFRVPATGPIEP